MINPNANIYQKVAAYYSKRLEDFGATARGVDWNDIDSQNLRFLQLCKLIRDVDVSESAVSVSDYGCGYGAFLSYLRQEFSTDKISSFLGIDISEDMVSAAQDVWKDDRLARFMTGHLQDQKTDFAFASGIFNVCLQSDRDKWLDYMLQTIRDMDAASTQGFAFNCLTSYSDEDKKSDKLYYADPCFIFDFCKTNFSRNVSLLHDYNLYEFTILVRK